MTVLWESNGFAVEWSWPYVAIGGPLGTRLHMGDTGTVLAEAPAWFAGWISPATAMVLNDVPGGQRRSLLSVDGACEAQEDKPDTVIGATASGGSWASCVNGVVRRDGEIINTHPCNLGIQLTEGFLVHQRNEGPETEPEWQRWRTRVYRGRDLQRVIQYVVAPHRRVLLDDGTVVYGNASTARVNWRDNTDEDISITTNGAEFCPQLERDLEGRWWQWAPVGSECRDFLVRPLDARSHGYLVHLPWGISTFAVTCRPDGWWLIWGNNVGRVGVARVELIGEMIPLPMFWPPLPEDVDPPSPPQELPMQPYVEDLVAQTNEKVKALYANADRTPDAQYPVWVARTVYDYCDGLSWTASEAKHLNECREALGLSIIIPPVSTDWPRRGLSYYTSLTDPRLNISTFAARLREAGANFTRVWLIDAWAVSEHGGQGCYDGWLPWVSDSIGRFDLWNLNATYFDRLRYYVEQMNENGILPQLSGLELYSWSDRKAGMLWVPDANQGPFRRNKQGIFYADDSALDRIGLPSGEDAFLVNFYAHVVRTLSGLVYTIELANEMPQKELHVRLRDRWREAGYTGYVAVNRNEDTPGQYDNMQIGSMYDLLALHGKRDLGYLTEVDAEEPRYRTFLEFYNHGVYSPSRIILSSDGCRKSTHVDDAYDYDALGEVFRDALDRGFSIEHQSRLKLRGFTDGRIDLDDLEVDWFRSVS